MAVSNATLEQGGSGFEDGLDSLDGGAWTNSSLQASISNIQNGNHKSTLRSFHAPTSQTLCGETLFFILNLLLTSNTFVK